MRIGHGFDVHRFAPERKLILGGVEIPYHLGLLGHSDADVLCHAISDALLGAAALGDIGKHFPDRDPQYKDASSISLLQKVVSMLEQQGYRLMNVDATVVMQQPKVAPFIDDMRNNLARAMGVSMSQVSVKATTTEGLGFEGRGEGVSAHAVVLIEKINKTD